MQVFYNFIHLSLRKINELLSTAERRPENYLKNEKVTWRKSGKNWNTSIKKKNHNEKIFHNQNIHQQPNSTEWEGNIWGKMEKEKGKIWEKFASNITFTAKYSPICFIIKETENLPQTLKLVKFRVKSRIIIKNTSCKRGKSCKRFPCIEDPNLIHFFSLSL